MNDKDQKSNGFVKLNRSPQTDFLMNNYPKAFFLLTKIAYSARRYDGDPDGLKAGEALIGDWESYDMSERNYRTAKDILIKFGHIEIIETNRTRKKNQISSAEVPPEVRRNVTTSTTTRGTKAKIVSSTVYDINLKLDDDLSVDRPTTDRRPTDDELRKSKNIKKEKKLTTSNLIHYGNFVRLKFEDYEKLCKEHTQTFIDDLIAQMNDYCSASKPGGYKDYAAALRVWIRNRKEKIINLPTKTSVDRRTVDKDGKPVENEYRGMF